MLPVSKPFEVIFFLMYRTFVDKHFFAVPILQILFRVFWYLLRLVLISQTVVISTPADLWGRFHSPGARVPVVFPVPAVVGPFSTRVYRVWHSFKVPSPPIVILEGLLYW